MKRQKKQEIKKPEKTMSELIADLRIMAMRSVEEARKSLEITKLFLEQHRLQGDLKNAITKEKCKSCICQFDCQRRFSTNIGKIEHCQSYMLRIPLTYSKTLGIKKDKFIIPTEHNAWIELLNSFIQYRTKYDSGLDGQVNTDYDIPGICSWKDITSSDAMADRKN